MHLFDQKGRNGANRGKLIRMRKLDDGKGEREPRLIRTSTSKDYAVMEAAAEIAQARTQCAL